jgi:hypothetical protein
MDIRLHIILMLIICIILILAAYTMGVEVCRLKDPNEL